MSQSTTGVFAKQNRKLWKNFKR